MNSSDWLLDTDGELPVFGRSVGEPVDRFLSSAPDDPTSIHKSRSKSGWVEGLSPYLSLNWLL